MIPKRLESGSVFFVCCGLQACPVTVALLLDDKVDRHLFQFGKKNYFSHDSHVFTEVVVLALKLSYGRRTKSGSRSLKFNNCFQFQAIWP